MYSPFQLALKYLKYYISASNGKGHGIHSPFVFNFTQNLLSSNKISPEYTEIEQVRKNFLKNERILDVEDFGAGSLHLKFKKRKVKSIAATSLKPAKYARLLGDMAKHYQCRNVIELGTSLGITTSYLAKHAENVYSFEGSGAIAAVAQENFKTLGLKNIKIEIGPFDKTLPAFASKNIIPDLVFLDGNHREEPTLQYFGYFLETSNEESIFVFDDIHWSQEMEAAWEEIKQHKSVTLTIDLFFIGIVFFKKEFKVKQHFVIRY